MMPGSGRCPMAGTNGFRDGFHPGRFILLAAVLIASITTAGCSGSSAPLVLDDAISMEWTSPDMSVPPAAFLRTADIGGILTFTGRSSVLTIIGPSGNVLETYDLTGRPLALAGGNYSFAAAVMTSPAAGRIILVEPGGDYGAVGPEVEWSRFGWSGNTLLASESLFLSRESTGSGVRVWRLAPGEPEVIVEDRGEFKELSVAPEGGRFALVSRSNRSIEVFEGGGGGQGGANAGEDGVEGVEGSGGGAIRVGEVGLLAPYSRVLAWSPDGSSLFWFGVSGGSMALFRWREGDYMGEPFISDIDPTPVGMSEDRLLFFRHDAEGNRPWEMVSIDTSDGSIYSHGNLPREEDPYWVSGAPRGPKYLIWTRKGGQGQLRLYAFDLETGVLLPVGEGDAGAVWSPSGYLLLTRRRGGELIPPGGD